MDWKCFRYCPYLSFLKLLGDDPQRFIVKLVTHMRSNNCDKTDMDCEVASRAQAGLARVSSISMDCVE